MIKFPSIDSFRHAVATVARACDYHGLSRPVIQYRGTVKLHGTNAGIHVDIANRKLTPQSRERVISVDSDNAGFARWVADNHDALFDSLFTEVSSGIENYTVFGEWIGPSIQKNVAINSLDEKQFVAINVVWDNDVITNDDGSYDLVAYAFGDDFRFNSSVPGLRVVTEVAPVYIDIDFAQPDASVAQLEELTAQYEAKCPWGALHGIEGIGEGLVWEPTRLEAWRTIEFLPSNKHTRLWFKTKGEKHGNKATNNKVKVAVTADKIEDFNYLLEQILPDWRLEQGASKLLETSDALTINQTGEYIKWVVADVYKEELDVVEASEFEWKVVAGELSKRARQWFLNRVRL